LVPAREARALAVLVPGMTEPAGDASDPVADEADRAFAFQGAVRLAEAAARPRCLITVDDAQWADPASRILLGRLVRSCDRVCLVAACQPDGGTAAVSAAELFGIPAWLARQIMLGPLPAGAVRALFSAPGLADIIITQTSAAPSLPGNRGHHGTGGPAVHPPGRRRALANRIAGRRGPGPGGR
jgi:hypothetical protein